MLAEVGYIHRRTAQLLTAAGGDDLDQAAERLAGWADPVVEIADLEQRLDAWLPDGAVAAPSAVWLTRRLLCDAAGLARTPWSAYAVSVASLEAFVRTAMDLADDAELINENALRRSAAERGFDDAAVEVFYEVCGFERLFGSLAVRRNRFSLCQAALLDLRRSASRHEVAEVTGLTPEAAGMALSTCASVVRTGYGRWAAHHDPRFAAFAEAVGDLADDVGLINEPRLEQLASQHGWSDHLDHWIAYAGYLRLAGEQLAASDTHNAKVKAAVVFHGGSAPIEQVADTAQLSVKAATSAARNIASVRLAKGTCRIVTPRDVPLGDVARANADDVGIIDVDGFSADAHAHGHRGTTAELAERCGLVTLFGRFALKASTDAEVKAALLDLQRPAATSELAAATGRSPKAVSHAVGETASIVQVGRRWTIDTADGALGRFAAAAAAAADDVGLINEQDLQDFATERGWSDRYDDLAERCGLARVGGRLALDNTRKAAVKAALLNLGRPATTNEIAAAAAMGAAAAANVLTTLASVTRIRPSLWVTADLADGVYARFGAALRLCSDDAGLINEPRLREIAQRQAWPMPVDELIEVCGLPRPQGRLAMADTVASAAKAALLELGRPATLYELADITGHAYGSINAALSRVGSVQWTSRGVRGERGLLAVSEGSPQPG